MYVLLDIFFFYFLFHFFIFFFFFFFFNDTATTEIYTLSLHDALPLPSPGEPKRAILETFTKQHSAEYQAQALIDLAFGLRKNIADLSQIEKIVISTSAHTHHVIGTGAGDPQKLDPQASRETLDHSIMYIFAVALED